MVETRHRLAPLLEPRSIAIVGASPKQGTPGNRIIGEVLRGGFTGALHAVNPNYDEVEGLTSYPSIGDLPEAVDLAILMVANHRIEEQLAAAIDAGAQAAAIFSSCVMEGDRAPALLERLGRRARDAGLQVLGGNCMGLYNLGSNTWICPFAVHGGREPGGVTLITHSGSAFTSLLNLDNRLRFNIAVSSGQEIATTAADYLDYALDQPATRVCALFLETIRDPEGFVAALAKARSRDVPVVAVKVGASEAASGFALSHSGALVGSDAAFDALCDAYGVIRVASLDELVATAALLALPRRAGPGGIAAIMDSGGERAMLADLAETIGVSFAAINRETTAVLAANLEYGLDPVNPCDAWGTMKDFETTFPNCFDALVNDPDTAIGLFMSDIRDGAFLTSTYVAASRATAHSSGKPVAMVTWVAQQRYGTLADELIADDVLVLDGVEVALKAVRGAFAYRDFRARPAADPPAPPAAGVVARWRQRLAADGALDEAEGLALFADFGIPTLAVEVAGDRDGALRAAGGIGFPVVLKTAMPGIHHKSDVGGVKLGLADDAALAAAYDDLAERLGPRVLVAPMAGAMAGGNVELALGVTRDAQFGPLVVVGAGGVLVEVMDDARCALPPIDAAGARRLIDRLRIRPLFDGARGAGVADIGAAAEAVARLSVLAATLGDCIAEIDVNPLIVGAHGCVAVDALVVGRTP